MHCKGRVCCRPQANGFELGFGRAFSLNAGTLCSRVQNVTGIPRDFVSCANRVFAALSIFDCVCHLKRIL